MRQGSPSCCTGLCGGLRSFRALCFHSLCLLQAPHGRLCLRLRKTRAPLGTQLLLLVGEELTFSRARRCCSASAAAAFSAAFFALIDLAFSSAEAAAARSRSFLRCARRSEPNLDAAPPVSGSPPTVPLSSVGNASPEPSVGKASASAPAFVGREDGAAPGAVLPHAAFGAGGSACPFPAPVRLS